MKIGIDIRALDAPFRTGVGEYIVDLLEAVFKQPPRHDYYLFSNAFHPRPLPFLRQANVHMVQTRYPNKLLTAATAIFQTPKIDRLITRKTGIKLDIFFSPNLNVTALSKDVKHVLMIHDLSFIFFPNFYTPKQRLWHWLAKLKKQANEAAKITVPSENTKRDVINYLGVAAEKITVLYPGIPTSLTKSDIAPVPVRENYSIPEKFILFVGSVEPRKNILSLITAYEQARKKLIFPYSLIIVGALGKDSQIIRNKIDASPYRSSIQLLGFITANEKKSLYRKAGLVVYASWYEGFGFPMIEAAHAGIPIITSNRSSMPEVAGKAAHLVNPHYPDEITDSLVDILNNPKRASKAVAWGFARARDFSWEKTAAAYLNTIEQIK